jgi:predicted DNA-binding transcriptional regulator AlpA
MSTNSNEQKLPPKLGPQPPDGKCHAFLDTSEAAQYLRLSRSCLAKWRCQGGSHHPAYHLVGRKVVYAVADLDAWLASRRRRSTSDAGK